MEIEVKQKVNVPISPWCGNCYRKENDKNNQTFCTLFNRFVYIRRGKFMKCRECYMRLYDALEQED